MTQDQLIALYLALHFLTGGLVLVTIYLIGSGLFHAARFAIEQRKR